MLQRGENETLKATVHGAMGLLALTCFCYNAAAWTLRRERHLAANVIIYGALTALEWRQVRRHLKE